MPNLVLGGGGAAASVYDIDQSLRFDDGDSAYLSRTPGSVGNRKTWTFSCWVKRANLGRQQIFSADMPSGGGLTQLYWESGNQLSFYSHDSTGNRGFYLGPLATYRDVGAWYHILVNLDTTQATDSNRAAIYINGEKITAYSGGDWGTPDYPQTQDEDFAVNNTQEHVIGKKSTASSEYYDGYLAEVHLIDGTALDASSFGETDAATNQWKPIEVTGLTYGTNGFYEKYSSTELAASFEDSANHTAHTVTANGNVHTDTTVKKIGTASAQFDGTGDYLSSPDSSDWDLYGSAGSSTLEFWVNHTTTAGSQGYIAQSEDSSNRWWLAHESGSGMQFEVTSGGVGIVDSGWVAGAELVAGSWYHIAVVKNGNDYNLYVDGVSKWSVTDSSTDTFSGSLYVGYLDAGSTYPLNGYMDEIRISNSARYTTTFTPSTTAFVSDSNTKLLLHCDGADGGTTFTDSSDSGGGRHTITAVGDVANTRAQYKIGDSSIKFDGTGDYLSVPDSSDWAFGTGDFTLECWIRRDGTSSEYFISIQPDSNNWLRVEVKSLILEFNLYVSSSYQWASSFTHGMSTDTWYHLAFVRESTSVSCYINGVLSTSGATTIDASDSVPNWSTPLYICSNSSGGSTFTGYMDEIRISDSARYTTDFDPVPTTAFVADSNTKLLIHSDFNGGLGADSSGNKNDFSVTNLVATDQMIDTPTNNFATLNPLGYFNDGTGSMTFSEGNLKLAGSGWARVDTTIQAPKSGKWYAEFLAMAGGNVGQSKIGVGTDQYAGSGTISSNLGYNAVIWYEEGQEYQTVTNGSNSATSVAGIAYVAGDVIGILLNEDDGEVSFYVNNSSPSALLQNITLPTTTDTYGFGMATYNSQNWTVNFGQDSSFAGNKTAQGNGGDGEDFYYTPPAGFKALNSDNLPDPAIADPTKHFNSILYTGNGGTQALTGVGFAPDFFWNKNRTGTYQHMLYNTISGATKYLSSGETDAEATDVNSLTSFDSDGVTLGSAGSSNATGVTSVAWNWKAGGTPTTDNLVAAGGTPTAGSVKINGANLGSALAGTIAATRLSASTTAGFSIVSYTGTGSAATISHGLSQKPDMIILKKRSGIAQWPVGSEGGGIDWNDYLALDKTNNSGNYPYWNDTAPTASVFSIGTDGDVNESTGTYIAYCFHSIEGYSKVGSYVGNGVVDGTFVYLGFKPAFLFWKQSSAARDWAIIDNSRSVYNDQAQSLFPNDSAAEYDGAAYGIDLVSNGFKWRSSNSTTNISSGTYIYYAIAESPFKTSNAR